MARRCLLPFGLSVNTEAAGSAPEGIQLSERRFACHRTFRGTSFIDVREYYSKDGELVPGSKGVTLAPPAWSMLARHVQVSCFLRWGPGVEGKG